MNEFSEKQIAQVESFAHLGYVNGYKDKTFKSEGTLNRAEIVIMDVLNLSFQTLEVENGTSEEDDTSQDYNLDIIKNLVPST